jgi:hypothetical protein
MNKRDASNSINGYSYQRYMSIYYILNKSKYIAIKEEGAEDIDLYYENNDIDTIQVKYHTTDSPESLTKNDGLYKVIKSNYNKNNIRKIIYQVYNTNENNIFNQDLIKAFENKLFENIGKYFILLHYKKLNNNINIKNIHNINEYLKKIEFNNNELNDEIFLFFNNKENCIKYFSKFEFIESFSFNDLKKEIKKLISEKYDYFINDKSNIEYKDLKCFIIESTILNKLTNSMMIDKENRLIKFEELDKDINEQINTFSNSNNLYYELLKQQVNIIRKNNYSLNYEYIDINIDEYNVYYRISFYISILKNHKNNINIKTCNIIKNKLINMISSLHNLNNNENINFKLINYLNIISIYNLNNEKNFNLPEQKLFNIINPKFEYIDFFEIINEEFLKYMVKLFT